MNIFKIAFANIRKRKGAGISFLVMVIFAGLMLSMSLSLMIGGQGFYGNKVDELNAPHYTSFIIESEYKPEFKTFAESYPGYKVGNELETLFGTGTWKMKSSTAAVSILVLNIDELEAENSFYKPVIIDKQAGAMTGDSVILPIAFKFDGFKTGQQIVLDLDGPIRQFKIHGFYEDTMFGASVSSLTIIYLNDNAFSDNITSGDFIPFKALMMRFEKVEMHSAFATAFRKFTQLDEGEVFEATYADGEMSATMFMNIVSMFLIIFSVIILVIAFIVVTFSIGSSIAEDIANIGALKSMGYRNATLKGSQLIQYLMIAFVGAVFGSLVSLIAFGALGDIIASTSGLLWLSSTNLLPAIISIVTICGLTALVTLFATRKYKKITPINALRQGGAQKVSGRNRMPLDRGGLSLNIHLGLKRFCNSIKNNIYLGITVMLLVFVSLLVFCMSYNMNVDRTAMINMVGLEMSDLYLQTSPGVDINVINDEVKAHAEVDRTMLSGGKYCYIGEYETFVYTVEDYTKLTIDTIVKGRNPVADNEMTLGSVTATATKKKIGDTVKLDINDVIKEYKVVGIKQNIGDGGGGCNITFNAIEEHMRDSDTGLTDFKMSQIYVYLKDGVNSKDYMAGLKAHYGSDVMFMDVNEAMDNILSSMGDPLMAVSVVMVIITLVIIAFVLFLITSALIRKNKREFGIMKAIGYRNRSLVFQLFLSLLPALLLGTVLGTLLGFFVSNPLLSVFFSSAGLLKTYFIIPVAASLFISLGVLAASLGITYLIAFRLRKISPQKLIVEQ